MKRILTLAMLGSILMATSSQAGFLDFGKKFWGGTACVFSLGIAQNHCKLIGASKEETLGKITTELKDLGKTLRNKGVTL